MPCIRAESRPRRVNHPRFNGELDPGQCVVCDLWVINRDEMIVGHVEQEIDRYTHAPVPMRPALMTATLETASLIPAGG